MTYFNDHIQTEAELHTIGALLCVLDEVTSEYLCDDQQPMASGIINLTCVVAARIAKAQELHEAEYQTLLAEKREEPPIAAMHREIVRRHAVLEGDHGLTDEEFTAHNMATVDLAKGHRGPACAEC